MNMVDVMNRTSRLFINCKFLQKASGSKPYRSRRCSKARRVVLRQHSKRIWPDTCPRKFATPASNSMKVLVYPMQDSVLCYMH